MVQWKIGLDYSHDQSCGGRSKFAQSKHVPAARCTPTIISDQVLDQFFIKFWTTVLIKCSNTSWLLLLVVLGGQVHTDHHFGPNDLMGSPGSQQVSLNTYYPDNPTIDALHILQQLTILQINQSYHSHIMLHGVQTTQMGSAQQGGISRGGLRVQKP